MVEGQITAIDEELKRHPIVRTTLDLLAQKLPQNLSYHSLLHTQDVVSEALQFGIKDNLPRRSLELLAIAAACHDVGFITRTVMNEPLGAAYAREQMEKAGGYTADEIALVERMILDTPIVDTVDGPRQVPSTDLSRYLLDADLSNLGRDDFFEKGELLRQELGQEQNIFRSYAYRLLNAHQWLTSSAQALRQNKKEENLKTLKSLIGL